MNEIKQAEPVGVIPRWTRLVFVGRLLRLLVYPLATMVLGHVLLFNVEQAQEAMQATLDAPWTSSGLWWFVLAYFMWSVSAWYTARLLLCKRWTPTKRAGRARAWSEPVGGCVSVHWARAWVTWLPRAMAVACTLPTAAVLLMRQQALAATLCVLSSAALLAGLVFRRRVWMRWTGEEGVRSYAQLDGEQWARFDDVSRTAWGALIVLGGMPWLIVLLGAAGGQAQMTQMARHIGAPGLVLLGLASFNVVGSMGLVYAPMQRGWGSWAWVPVLFWIGFSAFNENHPIGQRESVPAPTLPPVAPAWDLSRWLAQRRAEGRQDDPIYLVALSGGASRAAYWGAYTLAWLDDWQHVNGGAFLSNVYALSGVSGGSLGAATLVSALAGLREGGAAARQDPLRLSDWMTAVLTLDDLSPAVQGLLYVDLIGRLSPVPLPMVDRSHALERSWEQDTGAAARSRGATTPWFRLPMESLYVANTSACVGNEIANRCMVQLPRLILNAASAVSGEPVLQTALDLQHPLAVHMRDPQLALSHMTLSEAVYNSARFPYLSPAGQVLSAQDRRGVDYWVDGGYFENSGAWALQVLLQSWAQSASRDWREALPHLRVIVFSNDPVTADSSAWLPPDGVSDSTGPHAYTPQSSWMMEVVGPAKGLYATRTARAQSETYRLAHMLAQWRAQAGLSVEPVVYQLRMPQTEAKTPSMNWFINVRSSCVLRSYVWGEDQCPQVGAPALPAHWQTASGYQRYRAELTRLMTDLEATRRPAPGLRPQPVQPSPSIP